MSAVSGTVMEQVQTAAQKLSQLLVVANVSDAVTDAANAVSTLEPTEPNNIVRCSHQKTWSIGQGRR